MTFDKTTRHVNRVFVHCSASDHDDHDDVSVMREWHEKRGWRDVGYHFFIKKDGTVQNGRDLEWTPSAQRGHNTGTIAICLHGLLEENFTQSQFSSLRRLCRHINSIYSDITFHGHKEVANKSCPVFDYVDVLGLDDEGNLGI